MRALFVPATRHSIGCNGAVHRREIAQPGLISRIAQASAPGDMAALRWGLAAGAAVTALLTVHHFAPAVAAWLFN